MKQNVIDNITKICNDKFPLYEKSELLKVLLVYTILSKSLGIKNDPLNNLLKDYKQIIYLLGQNIQNIFNYFFFAKNKIHKILYEEEEFINIQFDETKNNLAFQFYLNLLINDNLNIQNYSYSFDFIIKINNIQKEINGNLKSIFFSKFIIDLIKNYKQLDEYSGDEEEKQNKLENIQYKYETIIEKNTSYLIENNNNMKTKKVDEIYSEIINSLIIKEKLENYEYAYDIMKQLDLENIDITLTMFERLEKILKEDKEYIKKYVIKKKEDLYNEKTINFYYILLKFILKNSIYIYEIPFLLNIRKKILNIIKSDKIIYDNMKDNKNKLEYIIKIMADSKYYFQSKYLKELKEILNYYKAFLFESKKEDINKIQDIIENNKEGYEKYLSDYDMAKKKNLRFPIIKYLINSKEPGDIKDENKIKEKFEIWSLFEIMIINKKFKKMKKETKQLLLQLFQDENNKKNLLKIFKKNQYDFFIKAISNILYKKNYEKNTISSENNSVKKESRSTIQDSNLNSITTNLNLTIEKYIDNINLYNCKNDQTIISNIDEIEKISTLKNPNIIRFFYFNRNAIHKIMLDEDKVINFNIELNKEKENLNIYFYISLLINENTNILNYSFSFDLIKEIENEQKNQKEAYKIIIIAKIIIELINCYKQTDDYNEEEKTELEMISKNNEVIIKNNIKVFKDIGLNWNEKIIKEKKIDEIYIEIIDSLIKLKELEKINDANIINKLDLENIDLTQKMLDNLNSFFNENINITNSYKIENFQDFNDKKKIKNNKL